MISSFELGQQKGSPAAACDSFLSIRELYPSATDCPSPCCEGNVGDTRLKNIIQVRRELSQPHNISLEAGQYLNHDILPSMTP